MARKASSVQLHLPRCMLLSLLPGDPQSPAPFTENALAVHENAPYRPLIIFVKLHHVVSCAPEACFTLLKGVSGWELSLVLSRRPPCVSLCVLSLSFFFPPPLKSKRGPTWMAACRFSMLEITVR